MKLQQKILLLFVSSGFLVGGPLMWIVRQTARQIDFDDVAQKGIAQAANLADRIAPEFPAGQESSLLPPLQAAQEQTGALYAAAIDVTGLVLAHTNVTEARKVYADAETQRNLNLTRPRSRAVFYRKALVMEAEAPVWSPADISSPEDFLLSGNAGGPARRTRIGVVRLALSLDEVLDRERRLSRKILMIMTPAGGIAILFLFIFMRRMLRPIQWLSASAARIARGEYGASIPMTSHDELGDLADDFNRMSATLAETTVSKKVLQESQDELMEAQRVAHIGSYRSLADRSQVTWSDEVYRIFGRDPKLPPPSGDEQKALFTPESWAKFVESRNEALQSGKSYAIDLEIIRSDGALRWIMLRGEPIGSSDGRATGIRGTVQDITDSKLTQNLIEQKERYFRSLIENATDIITVLDAQGVIRYESPSITMILGYRPEEMTGSAVLQWIHPDDQNKVVQAIQSAVINPGAPVFCEYRFRHKNGAWRILESMGSLIPGVEGDHDIVVNSREVTERKQSEEQRALLFTAIEQSRDSIVITNEMGIIEYVNRAFERVSGFSRQEAIGQNPRFLKSGKHDRVFYEKMWSVLKAGHSWENILTNKKKDGSLFEEEASISPILNEEGLITHYVAVKRDITERRKMEEIMRASDKLAAVGRLAGGVAHEINNPLGVILGFAQGMLRRIAPGDVLEMPLKAVEREAIRCKNLVLDLLTFSRTSRAEREPMDFNHAIEGALSLVMAQARLGQIRVEKNLAPDLPRILGNPNQIQQIIINLANNALDAMGKQGTLELRTEFLDAAPRSWVCLYVADTGSGIPPNVMPHIFEPFFTTKPVGQGTGLGLGLVHEIVQKHSGTIEVNSRPGRTEFCVKFPARASVSTSSPFASNPPKPL